MVLEYDFGLVDGFWGGKSWMVFNVYCGIFGLFECDIIIVLFFYLLYWE